jgi:hypothetical protein
LIIHLTGLVAASYLKFHKLPFCRRPHEGTVPGNQLTIN